MNVELGLRAPYWSGNEEVEFAVPDIKQGVEVGTDVLSLRGDYAFIIVAPVVYIASSIQHACQFAR